MIKEALKKIMARQSLTMDEMQAVMEQIMTGGATDAQIGAFLASLAMKGESVDEIAGAALVMRDKAVKIPSRRQDVVDTCGTGGDHSNTFNISTAAAFVAAGAGAYVAKHGNRSVSSACGSADVLKALSVNIEIPPDKTAACLETVGVGFMFAPLFHSAMKYAIGPRRDMGVRTIFNILGPLTNPAGAKHQLLGVFSPWLVKPLTEVLQKLGSKRVLVVHGDGLDEITPCGKTQVAELNDGVIREYEISPQDFGKRVFPRTELAGGDAQTNAALLRAVLSGEKGAKRDAAVLNGGASLYAAGLASSLKEGVMLAEKSIDSGAAKTKLDAMVEFTRGE